MRGVGAPFTLGIGAHPLIARLRQHVVPAQPPQLFSIRVHPPNPPPRGFFCSLPFAGTGQEPGIRQPAAPDPLGGTPQTPQKSTDHPNGRGFGILLYCLTAERSIAEQRHYGPRFSEALPSLTVLTGRSAGGLSVAASSAHANGQRRSRQFSGFRV